MNKITATLFAAAIGLSSASLATAQESASKAGAKQYFVILKDEKSFSACQVWGLPPLALKKKTLVTTTFSSIAPLWAKVKLVLMS